MCVSFLQIHRKHGAWIPSTTSCDQLTVVQEASSFRANSRVVIYSSDICVMIVFIICNYI